LIDWCFAARQHKIGQFVPIYQGGLPAQVFEDSQSKQTFKRTEARISKSYVNSSLQKKQRKEQQTLQLLDRYRKSILLSMA